MIIIQIMPADNYWLKITEYIQCNHEACGDVENMYDTTFRFEKIIGWAIEEFNYDYVHSGYELLPIINKNGRNIIISAHIEKSDGDYIFPEYVIHYSKNNLSGIVSKSDPENPVSR